MLDSQSSLPEGSQLISTNPDVASVLEGAIRLKSPQVYRFQWFRVYDFAIASDRENSDSYVLIFLPFLLVDAVSEFLYSCSSGLFWQVRGYSGYHSYHLEDKEYLKDSVISNATMGRPRHDETQPIDLSCAFIPGFFSRLWLADISRFTDSLNRDGGDCSLEESCIAQFGTAPDYAFCPMLIPSNGDSCAFVASTPPPAQCQTWHVCGNVPAVRLTRPHVWRHWTTIPARLYPATQ